MARGKSVPILQIDAALTRPGRYRRLAENLEASAAVNGAAVTASTYCRPPIPSLSVEDVVWG